MNREEINLISAAGRTKLDHLAANPVRYLIRAGIAGAYVMIGALLSILSAAWFYETQMGTAKLLGAVTFSAALILVVLIGGELFTGTNFVLGVSWLEKKARPGEVIRLWLLCYVGNFIGVLILAVLIAGSTASGTLMTGYLADTIPGRIDCGAGALVLKGVMCNFLVCTGVFAGMKLKSEAGKCIAIIMVITTFVLAGFEHSIANMATFSLYGLLVPDADLLGCLRHMVWVTLGNVIGGAGLLGVPVWAGVKPETT